MRYLFASVLCCCMYVGFAQTTVEKYRRYDPKFGSCSMLSSINNELSKTGTDKEYADLTKTKLSDEVLGTTKFNQNLIKLNASSKYKEEYSYWSTNFYKYGISVANEIAFKLVPVPVAETFVKPLIQQVSENYFTKKHESVISNNKQEADKLISNYFTLIRAKNINYPATEIEFESAIELAVNNPEFINDGNKITLNKELIATLYKTVQKDKERIQAIEQKLSDAETNANDIADLKAELEKINKKLYGNVTLQAEQVNEVKSEIIASNASLETKVEESIKNDGDLLADVVTRQKEITKVMDEIKDEVFKNEQRIQQVEVEIKEINAGLKATNLTLSEVKIEQQKMNAKLIEHDALITQNSLKIDILSGYLYNSLNTGDKIEFLKKDMLPGVTKDEKDEMLKKLERVKTSEDIITSVTKVNNYTTAVVDVLGATGILKGNDLKVANQSVSDLTNASNIIIGGSKLFSGDPSGLISVMSGISGFSKRGQKPEQSAEMKMLIRLFQVMNQRFDAVDKNLDTIKNEIRNLRMDVADMQENMNNSFMFISEQLKHIDWNTESIKFLTMRMLKEKYLNCLEIEDSRKQNNISFSGYTDYLSFYDGINCESCIQGLQTLTIGNDNLPFLLLANSDITTSTKLIDLEVNKMYKSTKELFVNEYDEENLLYRALFYPVESLNDIVLLKKAMYDRPDTSVNLNKVDLKSYNRSHLDAYYNSYFVNEFSYYYTTYLGYFELKDKNSTTFKPDSLNVYLISDTVSLRMKNERIAKVLQKLIGITEKTIMQQSLLAGTLVLHKLYYNFTNKSSKTAVSGSMEALRNNYYLAANFATFFINGEIDLQNQGNRILLSKPELNDDELAVLNKQINHSGFSMVMDKAENYNVLKLKVKFGKDSVMIDCPHISLLISGKIVYPEVLSKLFQTRELLEDKLLDMQFAGSIIDRKYLDALKYSFADQ